MVYLKAPSVVQKIQCQMLGRLASNELKTMWKEAAMA